MRNFLVGKGRMGKNLEKFPLYNYLKDKDKEKSNTYPIMGEIVP